jgi:DNA-directed RNA polymerase subunit M/transcription elongation factor TFIIS
MNQLQTQNIDFSQAETYVCEECGHDRFAVNYLIRRFSPLISPTGQEMLTPIQAFACTKCGHINKDFLPEKQGL